MKSKTPFYRVIISLPVAQEENKGTIEAEWRSVEGSAYFQSPKLYKENGFLKRDGTGAYKLSGGTS